ncbi:MAG: threonylcarbamoyl-AMP synthase [Gammaproteobacteria bacterium]|nr:threonylcarbamoyl-AMP synthase [Gammaproteobacteria bacterium]
MTNRGSIASTRLKPGLDDTDRHLVNEAARLLRAGCVVAFPTETVYGLGADAANPDAVRRIFTIKGRPANHPLIVHISHASLLNQWAREVPEAARHLAERFWPGPLTLILQRQRHVLDAVTGGQDSVGLRVPDHPLALELLHALGPEHGLAAPSANRFGRISPTKAQHVRDELGEAVDLILDGGPCRVGLESTIISFVSGEPRLLRPGGIPTGALEEEIGMKISPDDPLHPSMRASGGMPSHYAPATPLEIWPGEALWHHALALAEKEIRVAVLGLTAMPPAINNVLMRHFPMPTQAADYGRVLYDTLRQADAAGFDRLLTEAPPNEDSWRAVADRLQRAAVQF